MGKKKKKSGRGKRQADWAQAKRLCRLSQQDVEMAKELGFSPRALIKNIPSRSQPWKAPVKYWIRELYEKKKEKARNRLFSELDGKASIRVKETVERLLGDDSSRNIP